AELALRKGTEHREPSSVPRDGMKTEREGGQCEPSSCDPAASQITDDDAATRDAIQLGDQLQRAIVIEVVKELRAEHDVDAAIGEGKGEGIAAHGGVHAVTRRGDQGERAVQRDRSERESAPSRDLASAPGKVGETRAYIQER